MSARSERWEGIQTNEVVYHDAINFNNLKFRGHFTAVVHCSQTWATNLVHEVEKINPTKPCNHLASGCDIT